MRDFCAIAVMAKAPRAGKVKTRLVPPLTAAEAQGMSGSFLTDITANLALARTQAPIDPVVAYAPAGTQTLFDGLLAPGTALLLADGEDDTMPPRVTGFGRSLLHAVRALFAQGYRAVCLLNADSPTLPTAFLCQAATALLAPGERVVLGPADDGGYYLIGMQAPHAPLFEDIAWSTASVCAETLGRVATLGIELTMLPPWYDVDDRAALGRLVEEIGGAAGDGPPPFAAPATARTLAALDLAARLRLPE